MKYLNNKADGTVIRINKIADSAIYYTVYENSILADRREFGIDKVAPNTINDIIVLEANKPLSEVKYDCAITSLSLLEPAFTIEEDAKNWIIVTGSTGDPTTLRLFIPNKAYDNALRDKNNPSGMYYNLWQVIDFGTQNIDSKFSQITYNSIVLYLLELLPEHLAVLEMYVNDGVIVESKI